MSICAILWKICVITNMYILNWSKSQYCLCQGALLSVVWVVFGLNGGVEQLLDLGKEVELET